MGAAAFVLAINLFVAGLFATAFTVVAAYERSAVAARWLAAAYGIGILNAGLEFILPYQIDPRPVGVAIFAAFLFALNFCIVGLARHYNVPPPWRLLFTIAAVSLIVNVVIIGMPRDSFVRAMLYQLPYVVTQAMGIWVILRAPRRQALDTALLVLFVFSALQFLSKPFLAALIGSGGSPQGYLGSSYAAYSQTLGAFVLIANGVLTLLIIVRDVMAEITARSETDTLSGLLNRRGFEDRADKALALAARKGAAGTMVVADLDYFKQINDTFGHEAGDRVIAAFGVALEASAEAGTLIGRLGGEEFAIFLPGAPLMAGEHFAETVRAAFSSGALPGLPALQRVTASFGVAAYRPGDSLSGLLRRTDAALYEAKKAGRDRIHLVEMDRSTTGVILRVSSPGGA